MKGPQTLELIRARIFHTPGNTFHSRSSLVTIEDGCLALENGTIAACEDYARVRDAYPDAPVRDLRGGYLLPGLIDTHVHFPQLRITGSFGYALLDWLERFTLPEEARFADQAYAAASASAFIRALISHGTTTALAFGSHFCEATKLLFDAAEASGMRLFSGLVISDRHLRPELHTTPDRAYRENKHLLDRVRQHSRLGYVVTPRFALSTSEELLETCRVLLSEEPEARFTTHINENEEEIAAVRHLFPDAADYLDVYERFDLVSQRSVFAHNVHATYSELDRLASAAASVSHCPCSNGALGSGIFPLRRHLESGVHFALGTDVGGGTGFGLFKEGLQSYLQQRLAPEPVTLSGGQLLYLATRAGAKALGIDHRTGDFATGKAADFVYVRPPDESVLAGVLREIESAEHALTAIFTLAGTESIAEVRVAGDLIFKREVAA